MDAGGPSSKLFAIWPPMRFARGIRDSMVWPSQKGAKVQWTAMGDGCVDMKTLFQGMEQELALESPYKLKPFQDSPGNFRISKKISGLPTPQFGPMTTHAFSLYARKGKDLSPLFHAPEGAGSTEKKPNRTTNWQNWKKLSLLQEKFGNGKKVCLSVVQGIKTIQMCNISPTYEIPSDLQFFPVG